MVRSIVSCFLTHSVYMYINRCVASMCYKSARDRLTAVPTNSTQITVGCGVDHDMTAVVFRMHACDNC